VPSPAQPTSIPTASAPLSNADIARQLTTVAQLLSATGENPFKVKAYRRAADTVQSLPDSVYELVQGDADLTTYSGIGNGIAAAIREIVESGSLRMVEKLRSTVSPELAALSEFPRLDPKRVQQIYRKLGISSVAALREKLESGEIGAALGPRVEHHVRQALITSQEFLLYDIDDVAAALQDYLVTRCGARRAEPTGAFRRRVEVIRELSFLVMTDDFPRLVTQMEKYGGRSERVSADDERATLRLPLGLLVTIEHAPEKSHAVALIVSTGSEAHLAALEAAGYDLAKLARSRDRLATEAAVYRKLGLQYIPPELREGNDEVALAAHRGIPPLVSVEDIRGDLHMHTTASDGAHSLPQMAEAARERGYAYIGIADHSQSLKIAGGMSEDALWQQLRRIDRLNAKLRGIRILKSAEVDIRVDGTLDYPDELLRELDYTVCSIHSRFGLPVAQQTERLLRAMDNPHFTILGHATGRLLLRRPGYQIDIERVMEHARQRGCFFEINSSPDRLDLSAAHARLARQAGIKIAINTDAHSTHELDFIRCGVDVARRAGLAKADVLNGMTLARLKRAVAR
jgi:DNA polymerase (family 10)